VPEGSIKKGEELAKTGGNGKTVQCAICHGADYRGIGNVPRLAGRAPYYMVRQLADMRSGARKGKSMALMVQVVANLSDEDIVNLVSYMSSQEP
jgi:cytochrome c553